MTCRFENSDGSCSRPSGICTCAIKRQREAASLQAYATTKAPTSRHYDPSSFSVYIEPGASMPTEQIGSLKRWNIKSFLTDGMDILSYSNKNKVGILKARCAHGNAPAFIPLYPRERLVIPTGLRVSLPNSLKYWIRISANPTMALKTGVICVSDGDIYDSVSGTPISITLLNTSDSIVDIHTGTDIAMMELNSVQDLDSIRFIENYPLETFIG